VVLGAEVMDISEGVGEDVMIQRLCFGIIWQSFTGLRSQGFACDSCIRFFRTVSVMLTVFPWAGHYESPYYVRLEKVTLLHDW
jgi:hypothetical protein